MLSYVTINAVGKLNKKRIIESVHCMFTLIAEKTASKYIGML